MFFGGGMKNIDSISLNPIGRFKITLF